MRESARRMLKAMREGHVITIMNGPLLCGTTAVPQRYKELIDHPDVDDKIESKRAPGKRYHRYFIPGALNTATKQKVETVVASHTRNIKRTADKSMPLFEQS